MTNISSNSGNNPPFVKPPTNPVQPPPGTVASETVNPAAPIASISSSPTASGAGADQVAALNRAQVTANLRGFDPAFKKTLKAVAEEFPNLSLETQRTLASLTLTHMMNTPVLPMGSGSSNSVRNGEGLI